MQGRKCEIGLHSVKPRLLRRSIGLDSSGVGRSLLPGRAFHASRLPNHHDRLASPPIMSYYSGYSAAGSSSSNTSFKDRTNELRSYVHHFKAASSAANPNGAAAASSSAAAKKQPTKGEFAIKAAAIGKDITDTTAKLARLAQRA